MRIKTLAISAIALVALAVPASAGAVTLIGSGSVAAQPVLQALFSTYTKKVNQKGPLRLHRQRRQRWRQGRPERHQPVRRAGPHAAAQRCRHDLRQDVPRRALHRRQPEEQAHQHQHPADPRHLPGAADQLEPGSGLGPDTTIDPVGRDTNGGTYNFFLQAVLNNELPASNVNALTADGLVVNAVKQDPNAIGYDGLAWQGKGQKALKVNGVPCEAKKISVEPLKYPLSRYLFLVLPGRQRHLAGAEQVHRLGPAQPGGRGSDRQGRRRPRLQQEGQEEAQMEEEYLLRVRPQVVGPARRADCSARWSAPSSACCWR